jgi:hypothetical protein
LVFGCIPRQTIGPKSKQTVCESIGCIRDIAEVKRVTANKARISKQYVGWNKQGQKCKVSAIFLED